MRLSKLLQRKNIKMVVCDMAGTTINEGGVIYKSIKETLEKMGCVISEESVNRWYGRDKREVLCNELNNHLNPSGIKQLTPLVNESEKILLKKLEENYFKEECIKLMDEKMLDMFEDWRLDGIKVTLNTGYPSSFQKKIIDELNLNSHIDDYISSSEVRKGRPYPYMIHKLMERNEIIKSDMVCKIGDTTNDILEGKNAKCGLTIGVLSGAGKLNNLLQDGVIVVDKITDLYENNKVYY